MPAISALPEFYRHVQQIDQLVAGVPDGAPAPFWPDDEDNSLLCVWSGEEITRLLSALKIGADIIYPDISHTVVWSFLRQLEFANLIPTGDIMQIITVKDIRSVDGGLSTANNWVQIDAIQTVTRDDTGEAFKVEEGGPYSLSVPAGEYHVEATHVITLPPSSYLPRAKLKLVCSEGPASEEGPYTWLALSSAFYMQMLHVVADFVLTERALIDLWGYTNIASSFNAWGDYDSSFGGNYGAMVLQRKPLDG